MAWNNQGGGNGSGWKGGGPWGPRPGGGGSGGGGGNQPDFEAMLKRSQDRLKQAIPGGSGLGTGVTVLLLAIVLAAVGFFGFTTRINEDQVGIVTRFGKFDRELQPGINLRWPAPIEEVYTPAVDQLNQTAIGVALAGDRSANRNTPEDGFMLTGDENIVDIGFVVRWQIGDAQKFLFNIRDGLEFLDGRPAVTVRDVAESAMREVVGKSDIQGLLTQDRRKTETAVMELMQRTLDSYQSGIIVREVLLQEVQPPADVVEAFRDVQAARIDQERLQNEAERDARRIIPEARGEAQIIEQQAQAFKEQTIAEAQGQSERFLKVYEQYKLAPEVTRKRMYLESLERVYTNTDKIILDQRGAGVVPYLPLGELTKRPTASGGQ